MAVQSDHDDAEKWRSEQQRMIDEQLRARGITDERVLQAMQAIPRHVFIADQMQGDAYADRAVPIGEGQTISQPYIVALMTQALEADSTAHVLEVGTGSGYQTAILSQLVKHVYTVERHQILAEQAIARFAQLNCRNISVHIGDGTAGWPAHAPYDHAMITAAGPTIPRAIVEQVRRGGTIVLPVGGRKSQHLQRLRVRWLGFSREDLGPVSFVPLIGRYGWHPPK
ncbi:MAG: protein-L-isoaspartate(D-aspartate) O-methyltransferase [Chloroflexota bacterium]